MNVKKTFHFADWDDFEVVHNKTRVSDAKSYYESYKEFSNILRELPKSELVKRGWMASKSDLASMVQLFQSIHSNKLGTLFRKSNTSDYALCSVWLARISTTAKLSIATKQIANFQGIEKSDLKYIAKLSVDEDVVKHLPEIMAKYGIALVYERALPNMKLDGVVFTLESGNPVIGISFRYPRLDHFWFTLLHELAHINLHFDQLNNPIFDDFDSGSDDVDIVEKQANRLAKNSFVERSVWRTCKAKYSVNEAAVIEFARDNGIHSAVVAGMLQKETNSYRMYRRLVDEVNIRSRVFGDE